MGPEALGDAFLAPGGGGRGVAFDIDGTLVRLEREEVAAFGRAFVAVFRVAPVLRRWEDLPVVTDRGIVQTLCQQALGRPATPDEEQAVARAHVTEVEAMAARDSTAFSAVPGARQTLEALRGRVPVGLATGNSGRAARVKLALAGLDDLALPLASSDDGLAREDILAACASRLGIELPGLVSVGDGAWDVVAARNLGLPFVGVAPTPSRAARLRAAGALTLLPDLRSPWTALRQAQVPGPPVAG